MANPFTAIAGRFGRFFGATISESAAFGIGGALSKPLEPLLQLETNAVWESVTETGHGRPLDIIEAVSIAVEDPELTGWARGQARQAGFPDGTFDNVLEAVRDAPPLATAYQLWRRQLITDAEFEHALRKAKLETRWDEALRALKRVLLAPAELANAVVQGHRSLEAARTDAELQGVSAADFQTMVDNTGLPPGPETGLAWLRRGILSEPEFDDLVREGHTKVKYIEKFLEARQQILSATQWASLWLRGWVTEAQAKAGGAQVGYGPAEMELLYKNQGRPATTRQVHIGWARGGRLEGAANEREAFEMAVRQSNVRTEYTDLLWSQRYTYPSAFVLRALAADGTFDRDQTEQILIESGWNPAYAGLAADKWSAAGSAGPGTKWADRARTRVFTEAWGDYLDGNADEPELRALLAAVGAQPAEQTTIVTLANAVRARTRTDLTQAQILKLYRKGIWPLEQAQAALEDKGMDPGDAADLLKAP